MPKRILYIFLLGLFSLSLSAQCPQIYDYLGNLSNRPYWVSCTGGAYSLNFQSNTSWGAYTLNFGDGTASFSGASYTSGTIITHTYTPTIDTFIVKLIIPANSCTLTGVVVMEKPVNASIQIPIGGVTTACAPKALLFSNSSTDVSKTTWFTWNFGDGTPLVTYSYTNSGQTISHTYNKNTVNCQTMVTLTARNYCTSVPTIANFNPIQIYDIDDAAITPSALVKCWPDNVFTFNNTTNRNCVPQGNTFQRQEKWNFGNYWGLGRDSIINWRPWPPTSPISVAYPGVGNYTIQLQDSNLCGVDVQNLTVSIVNPPTAGLIGPSVAKCQGSPVTFTNTSSTGYSYRWNFGAGGGFVNRPYGQQTFTYTNAGIYTVSVVALITGGGAACSDTERVVVTILPKPTANFSVTPNKGCANITGALFTDNSTSAALWVWNFGNGNTFNGQIPPAQNYTNTGNFVASLTVTASNSCVHSYTAPVTVYPKPTASFTLSSACVGSLASFSNSSSSLAGNPIVSWNWDFGDASPTATSSAQHPTHTYSIQNTYTVQLIASTANCKDTVYQSITINEKPVAGFTVNPINGCPNLSVEFTNTSSNATSYSWNFGNGSTSTATSPSQVYTNTLSVNKSYTISLTASTGLGCADTKTTNITLFANPKATFKVNAPTGCSPVAATFTNTSSGASSYLWAFGNGATANSTLSVLSHTYTNTSLLIQTYTVQLVALSANGCRDSTTLSITAYPRPSFNFSMIPSTGCSPLTINFPPVLGAVGYQWDFGDGSPTSSTTNPTHTFTNVSTTDKTYTVQLIAYNAFSCVDTAYGYPVVFAKPQAHFAHTPTVGCSPLAITFTNTSIAGSVYLWRLGDGHTTTTSNVNHVYTNTSPTSHQTFTCSLTAISSKGCRDSLDKQILVYYKPQASFSLDTPKCLSKTITFTNTSQGLSTVSWSFGDSSPLSTNANPVHTYTNNTISNMTFSIQLIATSAVGCKDTATANTVIYAKPIANGLVTPSTGCSPLSSDMLNSSSLAHTYLWKYGDGRTASTYTTSHTYNNTSAISNQTFTCTLVAINANGCVDSVIFPVLTYFKPQAQFSLDTPKCISKTITFTNNTPGLINNQWDFGDLSASSSVTNPIHTYSNSTSNNITFTVQLITTTADGCRDTTYGYPIIYAKPIANASLSPTAGCSPLMVGMNNASRYGHSYLWKYGDGNITTSSNTNYTYTNTGSTANKTYTCTLIAMNNNGCQDSISFPILTYFKPTAHFSLDTPKCISKTITFKNSTSGVTLNAWDFGDLSTSSITNPAHTYSNSTSNNVTYTVQLITTTANGCKDTTYGYPIIYAKPTADFALTATISCSPLTTNMLNLSSFATSYIWKYGDGNASSTFNTEYSYNNTSHSTDQAYDCKLIALNSNGCKDSISKPLMVLYNPKANFTVDTPGCSPKTLSFTNTSAGALSYRWDFNTSTSTNTNTTHYYVNTSTVNVTHTVQLIATAANTCKDTIEVSLIIHPKPDFLVIASPDSGCTPLSVNFPTIRGIANYQWNFGDGNIATTANPSNTYYNNSPTDKTFTVQLIGTDGYGCKDTSSKIITVFAKPIAVFQANPTTVYIPSSPVNCSNLSSGAVSYVWDFGDNTTSTNINPSHIYQFPGEYQINLVATNAQGCKDSYDLPTKITAVLESGIEIPNAFTPNPNGGNGGAFNPNDISNDVFHPVMRGIDKYELNIFSRWGELLFVSKDITIGWDGYYKGELCTQDIYVWKIIASTIDGKKINKTGDVLLLK